MKPLALDLCCGLGGWAAGLLAAGWRVIGVDLADFSKDYPGEFVQADLLKWCPPSGVGLVVASPPCEEFSRWGMPWTRAKNPPLPSLALVNRSREIAALCGAPFILENVRAAQEWLGRSLANCGPFHLWGDVPAIVPTFGGRKKESYGGKDRAKRAVIPFELSLWIGRAMRPSPSLSIRHNSIRADGNPTEAMPT